ncbi:MAG: hypothetical protein ACREBA_12300 [Nitrosotalea sp.]
MEQKNPTNRKDWKTLPRGYTSDDNKQDEFVVHVYRQGNIRMESVRDIPDDAIRIQTDIVKQDKNHIHRIKSGKIYDYNKTCLLNHREVQVAKFLWLDRDTILSHDEHAELHIPSGKYAVYYELKTEAEDVRRALQRKAEQISNARVAELNRLRIAHD